MISRLLIRESNSNNKKLEPFRISRVTELMASLCSWRRFVFDEAVQLCLVRAENVAIVVAEVYFQSLDPSHVSAATRASDFVHFFLHLGFEKCFEEYSVTLVD